MEIEADKGVCFFAYNNEQIDYVNLAFLAAKFSKKYLGLPVCLITDEGSYWWLQEKNDQEEVDSVFDYVVLTKVEHPENIRSHNDSPWTEFNAPFLNSNKHLVWEYSPFEHTLLLDIDYLLKSDFLLEFTDAPGVNMFNSAINLRNDISHINERLLSPSGVPMWWSTVVSFDRSDISELFFDTWAHVADNYNYYQMLYNFPMGLYRTDFCVSIVTHILNGMQSGDVIGNFANNNLINMSQRDELCEVIDENNWIFLSNDNEKNWLDVLVNHKSQDIHMMNKRSVQRNYEKLMETIDG